MKSIVTLGAALIATCAITAAGAQEIKIGYTADQSGGGGAELGLAGRWGFEAAVEDLNRAGGINGRKIVGVIRDDQGTPPKAIQSVNELIDSEKVVAIVGPANSGNALAWMHIAQQKKIPVLVPISTATEITNRYAKQPQNYLFRISMVDREQSALLVAYAVKTSQSGKIAVMADSTGYGQGSINESVAILKLHGIAPVAVEKFGPKDTDMTSQLSKIRAAGADTVIVYGLADANAHVLRSMEKINYLPTTLSAWGSLSSLLPKIAGKTAEHMIIAASTTEDTNERTRALGARVRKNFPMLTTFLCAAQAYDSVMLLAQAMRQAGNTDGEKVAAELERLQPVQGIIKAYDRPFTKTMHEALDVNDFHLARWKDGDVVRYEDAIVASLTSADLKK